MKFGRYQEAARMYKQLLDIRPSDLETLTALIVAYSHFDPTTARKLEERLPILDSEEDIDPAALENLSVPSIIKRKERKEPEATTDGNQDAQKQKLKKKRKRKNKPPKKIEPGKPIDPERWLPRYERSYYKGKRKGKTGNKGAQGAISASAAVKQQDGSAEMPPAGFEEEAPKPNQKGANQAQPTPPRGGKAGTRGRPRGRGKRR